MFYTIFIISSLYTSNWWLFSLLYSLLFIKLTTNITLLNSTTKYFLWSLLSLILFDSTLVYYFQVFNYSTLHWLSLSILFSSGVPASTSVIGGYYNIIKLPFNVIHSSQLLSDNKVKKVLSSIFLFANFNATKK